MAEQTIELGRIYSDREVAEFLFGENLKPQSWKTVQKMARAGAIRGKKIGRSWRFVGESILDCLRRK